MSWEVIQGDCIEAMAAMEPESVDAIVTDPPYGLEFMGKDWDALGRRIGHPLDPSKEITKDSSAEPRAKDNPWQKEASGYGAPRKNPRCRRCGRLKWTQNQCDCERPDWDTRTSEYAREMQAWHERWAREALRVLKPGGHLLAFGGTRTYHRLACGLEDAGFEIRDSLIWIYGSGFPKSLDVSKALREDADEEARRWFDAPHGTPQSDAYADRVLGHGEHFDAEADEWKGFGTALKPGHEPIVVARKPLAGTVVGGLLEHGTGALNIDGCRIAGAVPTTTRGANQLGNMNDDGWEPSQTGERVEGNPAGRWPANLILSHTEDCVCVGERRVKAAQGIRGSDAGNTMYGAGRGLNRPSTGQQIGYADEDGLETVEAWECAAGCPVAALDEQSGETQSRVGQPRGAASGDGWGMTATGAEYADSGGASRFFYCAKASRAEREAGLSGAEAKFAPTMGNGIGVREHDSETATPKRNVHPTVKPIDLMRWLVRLVTPPGATVLDAFAGSGTTGCAAIREGFAFIGIESDAEYAAIAKARMAWWAEHPEGDTRAVIAAGKKRDAVEAAGQDTLFAE